jgi:hypothetical protein
MILFLITLEEKEQHDSLNSQKDVIVLITQFHKYKHFSRHAYYLSLK